MKLYKIYTEDKNRKGIQEIINRTFQSYTLVQGCGVWLGTCEKSLIVEVIAEKGFYPDGFIDDVCRDIKKLNKQEAVFLTVQEIKSKLI